MLSTTRIGALACLVGLVGTMVFTGLRGVDQRAAEQYRTWLRELGRQNNAIEAELLRADAGVINHYDGLVEHTRLRKHIVTRLADVPAYLPADAQAEVRRALSGEALAGEGILGGLSDDLARQSNLIEDFKFHHAVLRHSVRYLPYAAQQLVEDALQDHPEAGALTAELNALFTEVLLYYDFGDSRRRGEIQDQVELLRSRDASFLPAQQRAAIRLLARHAEIILDKKEKVDEAFEQITKVPVAARIEQLRRVFERNHEAAADRTIHLRYASFVLAIGAILFGAAFIILRMKSQAGALHLAKLKLEETNQALEVEKDKQKELADLKSRFVSMTSHEFRTPLSVILSSSELLETYGERWGPDKRQSHLSRIENAAKRMHQMLEAVLIIGRSEAGMLEFKPHPMDVTAFCKELVDDLHMNVNTTHAIDARIDAGIDEALLDARLMGHLISNLLSNAMKYSPDANRVKLEVSQEGDEVVVAVSDEGIGIAPEDLDKLFETFRRGGNVGNISGTGLGLAIVQKAVDMHRGRIDVQSEMGVGTTFTVRLPLTPPIASSQHQPSGDDPSRAA